MTIILGVILAIASYFAWTAIHEFSHLFMAKKLVGVNKWKMKLYPHRAEDGSLRWGAVWYWMDRQPTDKEQAAISLAPRAPDLLAAGLFAAGGLLSGPLAILWFVFWGAGVVDLVNGSIGKSELSDLKRAAKALKKNPWWIRLAGFGTAVASIAVHFLI